MNLKLPESVIVDAVEHSRDGVTIAANTPGNRPIVYANQAFCRMVGYELDEVLGRDCKFLQGERSDTRRIAELGSALKAGQPCKVIICNYRQDGSGFWNELSVSPLLDPGGEITHFIGIQRDISLQVEREAQVNALLDQLSLECRTDPMTGLMNRRAFESTAAVVWSSAVRNMTPLSIFFVDIDHFKVINDLYGHAVGDLCLRRVADRLRSCLRRESDVLVRYGGEEFVVLCPVLDSAGCEEMASRIVEDLKFNIEPEGVAGRIEVTVSVGGVCIIPQPGQRIGDAVRQADQAMYDAKRSGRDRSVLRDLTRVNLGVCG